MNHFDYRNGVLHAEAVNLIELADAVGTPFYCYSTATLERHYRVFSEAFAGEKALVCYAMKANSNQSVLRTLAKLGAGADVVSGGELKRALAAGIPPQRSCSPASARPKPNCARRWPRTFSASMSNPSPNWNCCRGSPARAAGRARISVRVNPDVNSGSHAKISTGKSENKFGVPIARARAVYARAGKIAGHPGHRRRHAYRKPDHRSGPDGSSVQDTGRIRADACAPTATPSRMSISAAASAFPITWTARHRRSPPPMPRWSSG